MGAERERARARERERRNNVAGRKFTRCNARTSLACPWYIRAESSKTNGSRTKLSWNEFGTNPPDTCLLKIEVMQYNVIKRERARQHEERMQLATDAWSAVASATKGEAPYIRVLEVLEYW